MRGFENYSAWRAIATFFLVAVFEGFDIQSMGVAAPRLAPALGLHPDQMGFVLSSSIVGLAVGAAFGGRAADRFGRRSILISAMVALGIFSVATTYATGFWSLVAIRLLAGLGLGGVFPNLISLTTDAAPPRYRVSVLGLVYCGLPLGGALAGMVAGAAGPNAWTPVFVFGGCGPLLLIPLLAVVVPDDPAAERSEGAARPTAAFFGAPIKTTLLLWIAYFLTLMTVYTLLNWLPSLMVAKGLSKDAAAYSSISMNIGAALGSLILGRTADRVQLQTILIATYLGMGLSLASLALAHGSNLQLSAFMVGFFVIGGQLILYSLPPLIYPRERSGAGIGAAVAVGRFGSVLGPIVTGFILTSGIEPDVVPLLAEPGLCAALVTTLVVASGVKITSRPHNIAA